MLPRVPQSEMGVPVSQIASKRTVEAMRPDGSRVWVPAPKVVAGLEPDSEPEPDFESTESDSFVPAVDYPHAGVVTVPTGEKGRVRANLAVLELIAKLDAANRHATNAEQQILTAWSGWGGCATVFDESRPEWEPQRELLREALSVDEYRAARHSTLNAHYTDPAVAAVMWDALLEAGFDGGRVLEPGCGSGNFIGLAPEQPQTALRQARRELIHRVAGELWCVSPALPRYRFVQFDSGLRKFRGRMRGSLRCPVATAVVERQRKAATSRAAWSLLAVDRIGARATRTEKGRRRNLT